MDNPELGPPQLNSTDWLRWYRRELRKRRAPAAPKGSAEEPPELKKICEGLSSIDLGYNPSNVEVTLDDVRNKVGAGIRELDQMSLVTTCASTVVEEEDPGMRKSEGQITLELIIDQVLLANPPRKKTEPEVKPSRSQSESEKPGSPPKMEKIMRRNGQCFVFPTMQQLMRMPRPKCLIPGDKGTFGNGEDNAHDDEPQPPQPSTSKQALSKFKPLKMLPSRASVSQVSTSTLKEPESSTSTFKPPPPVQDSSTVKTPISLAPLFYAICFQAEITPPADFTLRLAEGYPCRLGCGTCIKSSVRNVIRHEEICKLNPDREPPAKKSKKN